MTNPDAAIGTNAAFNGRTTPNALNDVLATFSSRGVLSGFKIRPDTGLTLAIGGDGEVRDVAVAEDISGNRLTVNNRTGVPINVTLSTAPTSGGRIDAIVAYVQNPSTVDGAPTADNPSVCGLIVVPGAVDASPSAPDDDTIRAAITADGGNGSTAYAVVLGYVTVPAGITDITATEIVVGDLATAIAVDAALSTTSANPVQNKVIAALPTIYSGTDETPAASLGKDGDIYVQISA